MGTFALTRTGRQHVYPLWQLIYSLYFCMCFIVGAVPDH